MTTGRGWDGYDDRKNAYALSWAARGFNIRPSTSIGVQRLYGKINPTARYKGPGRSWEDHPILWNLKGKPFLYTCEPWDYDLDELTTFCGEHGLLFRIMPKDTSIWTPGGAWMIEIVRAADARVLDRGEPVNEGAGPSA